MLCTRTGRVSGEKFEELRHRLQISDWEMHRTHWAVKDGDIPQELFPEMISSPKKYDIVLFFAGAVCRAVPFVCIRALIVAIPPLEETRYS
jgi:hypothetical protein